MTDVSKLLFTLPYFNDGHPCIVLVEIDILCRTVAAEVPVLFLHS